MEVSQLVVLLLGEDNVGWIQPSWQDGLVQVLAQPTIVIHLDINLLQKLSYGAAIGGCTGEPLTLRTTCCDDGPCGVAEDPLIHQSYY